MTTSDHVLRAARQHLETCRLFGVDFVPATGAAAPTLTDSGDALMPPTTREDRPAQTAEVKGAVSDGRALFSDASSPELDAEAKADALAALKARHDETCPHCTTVTGHTQTVFGEGDSNAALLFIGEAPGAEEDRTGRPFVGRAGQKLDEIIKAMGLRREDVYIANILKSRPPNNRTPLRPEVDACAPFLSEQVRIIRPRVIVTLGGPSSKFILSTETGITRLRGHWQSWEDGGLEIPVMPTFHPAYLLRNYTAETRAAVWSDMQAVMERLGL